MTWRDRIETNPEVLSGKPVVAGTRIAVELVVELLAEDWATDEILEQYPHGSLPGWYESAESWTD